MRLPKQQSEREIFEALIPLIGMDVVPGSISQPDPPDIRCEIVDRGLIGVELVAIDAPETRTRLDNMQVIDDAWVRALTSLPANDQVRIVAEAADVFFSIVFDNRAGSRARTKALCALQTFLLSHPGHTGAIPLSSIGRPSGLQSVIVHRSQVTHGPKFSKFSSGGWLPPQISKVEEKLRPGRYQSDIPMELFVYAIHDEPDGAVGSLEELQDVIVKHLPTSEFQRAHVFHLGFQRHLSSHSVVPGVKGAGVRVVNA